MPETTTPVTSQPAPQAQNADAVSQSNGAENVSESAYAKRFFKSYSATVAPVTETAQAAPEPTQTEQPAPAVTEPVTEEAKASETPAPEPTEEAEDALSQSNTLPPEVQAKIQKRIDKITAQRKEAERKAEAAEAARIQLLEQLAKVNQGQPTQATEAQPPADLAPQPLAKINTIQELQKLHNDATAAVQFAEYNLDREDVVERQTESGEIVKGVLVGDQFYSKAQLRTIKYNALHTKDTEIPKRAQFLQAQHQAAQQALETYAFLKDPSSPEYQLADQFARQMPWLKSIPDGIKIIGKMVLGHKAEQEMLNKGKAAPKAAAPKARPSGDQAAVSSTDLGASRAPVGTMARTALAKEEERLAHQGGVTAAEFAASLTRKRQLRNSL